MDEFNAAKLLYDVLQGQGESSPSPERLKAKYAQILRGMPVEDEFGLLARWSGQCHLVHKLDAEVFVRPEGYQIPDYLCVVDRENGRRPFLVAVTSSVKRSKTFSKKWVLALEEYGAMLGLPVLVAFKWTTPSHPLWALTELERVRTERGTAKLDVLEMMKEDLFGLLFGFFSFQIRQGAGIVVKITKERVESETRFVGRLTDLHWQTPEGQRAEVPSILNDLFLLCDDEVVIEDTSSNLVQRFLKVADDSTMVHWALPIAVDFSAFLKGEQPKWRLARSSTFRFTLPELRDAVYQATGVIDHTLTIHPHHVPTWL